MFEQLTLFGDVEKDYHKETIKLRGQSHFLFEVEQPDVEVICQYIESFFDNDANILEKLKAAKGVWVKPNITGADSWKRGKTSNPYVLDGLLDFILKYHKASDIFVADSSVIGTNTIEAANATGILDICNQKGVQFVDLRSVDYVPVSVEPKILYHNLEISEPFVDKDNFKINLGKIKSTYGSPVGFTIKNAKGIIRDEIKYDFHSRGVQQAICDLFECTQWDLAMLEGLPISELGKPKCNGSVILSSSVLICDYYTALLYDALPEPNVRHPFHLNILSERYGLNPEIFEKQFSHSRALSNPNKLAIAVHGIKKLASDNEISIIDGSPCSGCVESFSKALASYRNETLVQLKDHFVLGADDNHTLDIASCMFIGNCAKDKLDMFLLSGLNLETIMDDDLLAISEKAKTANIVKGCPPTIDDMKDAIDELCLLRVTKPSPRVLKEFDYITSEITFDTYNQAKVYENIISSIPRENILFTEFDVETMIACEAVCAAICHSMNWDFLRRAVSKRTHSNENWVTPEYLRKMKNTDILELLAGYSKPERFREQERCEMLNILGESVAIRYGNFSHIFLDENGCVKPQNEIDEFFNSCSVFSSDKEQKKYQVLLQNLSGYSLLSDVGNYCAPAIDYHIIRTYIKRGYISPRTAYAREYLFNSKSNKRENTMAAIRSLCSQVVQGLSWCSILSAKDINNIDWWIGRSVCIRDEPDCYLNNKESQWLKPKFNICPFNEQCIKYWTADLGEDRNKYVSLNEPPYGGSSF